MRHSASGTRALAPTSPTIPTRYTPGPWREHSHRQIGPDEGIVAEVWSTIGWGDAAIQQADANVRLIAAAPDLLEALQWYEAKAVQMGRAAIDQDSKLLLELMKEIAVEYGAQARAAIAKATGEQP